jgi:hypothetical protein
VSLNHVCIDLWNRLLTLNLLDSLPSADTLCCETLVPRATIYEHCYSNSVRGARKHRSPEHRDLSNRSMGRSSDSFEYSKAGAVDLAELRLTKSGSCLCAYILYLCVAQKWAPVVLVFQMLQPSTSFNLTGRAKLLRLCAPSCRGKTFNR